jgi:hypothetical protein
MSELVADSWVMKLSRSVSLSNTDLDIASPPRLPFEPCRSDIFMELERSDENVTLGADEPLLELLRCDIWNPNCTLKKCDMKVV